MMMKIRVFAAAALAAVVPVAAGAQGVPVREGVTVVGRATQAVPVRTLRFVAYARGQNDEATVVNAMHTMGIADAVAGVDGNMPLNGTTLLRGTLRDVSKARIEDLGRAVVAFVKTHPGTSIDNVRFSPVVDDCSGLEAKLRRAAFADAHARAADLAAVAGRTLGPATALNDTGGSTCNRGDAENGRFGPEPAFDLTTLTAQFSSMITVTFGLH